MIIGGLIGGAINLWVNKDNIANFWQGLGYFGVGAAAGALGAGIGAGISSAMAAGGTFGAGFIGSSAAMTATTSFATGAAIGGGAGFTSGFTLGFGNNLMQGESFGNSFGKGLEGGVIGMFSGAALGGLTSGFNALRNGRTFWDGAPFEETTIFDQNLPEISQVGDNNCLLTAGEVVDNSFGGTYDQSTLRSRIAPNTDPKVDAIDDVRFWNGFARETGHTVNAEAYNSKSLGNILSTVNNNGRVAITLDTGGSAGHSVVLKSLTTKTIYRPSGTKIRFIYKAMNNGSSTRVSSSDFFNLFYIFR